MYSRFYRRAFLVGTVVILGVALNAILEPFWVALLWAGFLAFLFHPLHRRLTARFGGRAGASAGVITGLTPFLVVAPLAVLGLIFARQGAALIQYLRGRNFVAYPELLQRLEAYPVIGPALAWLRENVSITPEQIQGWLTDSIQSVVRSAATVSGSVVLGLVGSLVGFFLMLFLLFFFLRDGALMLDRVVRLIPMERRRRAELIRYLGDVTYAVLYGTAVTALIQGTLVGIGFALAGLPSPVVFGVLAAIAAFIPAAGTGLVLVPAVIWLAVSGRWGAAVFLLVWSVIVGFSDNFLRPVLAAKRADVSTLAVFVGVIGGVAAFGFIGIVLGPVLLSLIVALIRVADQAVKESD